MKFSLFRSGPFPRLAAAVAYGALAFGAVALVEHASATRPPPEAAPDASSRSARASLHIEIEAINPVAGWTVRLDGAEIKASQNSPTSWETSISVDAASRLSIETTRPAGTAPATNALRVRLARGPQRIDRTFWCGGDCVIDLALDVTAPPAATSAR